MTVSLVSDVAVFIGQTSCAQNIVIWSVDVCSRLPCRELLSTRKSGAIVG